MGPQSEERSHSVSYMANGGVGRSFNWKAKRLTSASEHLQLEICYLIYLNIRSQCTISTVQSLALCGQAKDFKWTGELLHQRLQYLTFVTLGIRMNLYVLCAQLACFRLCASHDHFIVCSELYVLITFLRVIVSSSTSSSQISKSAPLNLNGNLILCDAHASAESVRHRYVMKATFFKAKSVFELTMTKW